MTKTILCADDSATMQTVAQITFKSTEFEYVGARSADEALEKAKAKKPDLILADAIMPGKTGYELCQAIKSDPGLADVPVLMMCGNSQAFDPDKGKEAGADGHVTKPWDTQQLLAKVSEMFEQSKSDGVAKPAGAAPAAAAKSEEAPPKRAPTPPPTPTPAPAAKPAAVTPPKRPAAAQKPAPPRSATLMGMPTFKMPPGGKEKPAGVTSITPPSEQKKEAETPKPAAPAPKPVVEPVAAQAKPAAEARPATDMEATKVAPAPEPTPAPAARPAAAKPAAADGARPPMIGGTPTRRPGLAKANAQRQAVATAATVAREAGLDPNGPEIDLLVKLSSEVVERIVWEVVPELAETILRENLDKLTAKSQ